MSQHHHYRQGGGGGTPQSIGGVDQNSGSSIASSVTPQQTNTYTTQHQRVSSGSGAGQDLQFGNFHAMHHQVPHPHQQRHQQQTSQQQYNNPAYNHQHHHPYINNNSPASHTIDDAHYYNNSNNGAGLSDSGHYQTTGGNNNNAGSGWQQQQQPSSHHHHHHGSSLPASPYQYNGGQQQGGGGGGVSVGGTNINNSSSATTTPLIGAAVGGGGGSGHQHSHQGGGILNNSNNRNGRTRQLSLSSAMSSSRSRQNSATDFGNFAAATTSPTSASMPARRSSQQARNSPSFLYTNNSNNPTSPSFQHGNGTFGANNNDATATTDRNSAGGGNHRRFSGATGGGGGHNHHHHHNNNGGGSGGIPPTSPVALLAVSPHPDRASLPDIIIARAFDGDYGDDAENNNNHHSNSQSPTTTPATTDLLVSRRKSSPQEPEDLLDNTCTFDTDTKKDEGEENNEEDGDNNEGDENTLVAVMPTNRVHVRSARIVSTAVTKATLLRGDGIVCGDFFQRPGCVLGAECTKIHVVGREHVWEPISLPSDLLTRWSRPTSDSRTAAVVAALDASIPAATASITSTKDGEVDSASNRATEADPLEGTTSKASHKPSTITSSEAAEVYKLRAVQYPSGFNLFTYDTSMTTYLRIPSERIERTLGSEMFIECYNEFGGNFKTQFSLCSDFDPAIDMTFEGASSGCNVNRGNLDGSRAHQLSTTQSSLIGASISNMSTGGVADEEEDELRAVEPRPRRGCALGAQCPRIHCLEFDPVVSCKYSQTHMVLDEDVESFTAGRSEYDRDHGQHAAVHYYLPLGSGQTGDQQGNSHHHRSQRSSAGQRAAQLASPAYLTTTTVSMFASLPTPPQLCPWYSRLSSSIPSMVDAAAQQSVHRSHHHHRRRSSAASHQTATTTAADGSSEKNSTAATAPTTVVDLPRYYVRVYPQNCPPNVRDDFEDIPIDAVLVTEGSNCFLRALRSFVTKATQSSVAVSGKTSRKQSAIDAAEAAKAAAAAGRRGSSKTESPTTTHLTAVSPQSSRRVSIQSSSQQRRATLRLAVQVTPNDHVIVTPSTIKQPQHCAHFRLKQLCRKGPDCRFVHVLPGYPTTRLAGGGGGVSPSLGRSPQDAHLGFSGNNNNARRGSKPFGNNNRSHPSSPLQQDFGNIENNSLRGSLNLGASGNGERGSGHHQHPNNRRQQHHNNNTATTGNNNNNNTAGAERSGGGGGSYHNSYHQSYPHSREHSTASQEYGGFDASGYGQTQHIYTDPNHSHQYHNNNHAEINGVGIGVGDYSQQDWHHQQQYHHTQQQQQHGGGGGYQQQQMQQGSGGDHSWPPSPHQYHIPPSPSSQQTPTLGSSMNNISPIPPLPSQVQGNGAANRLTAVNSVTNSPSDAQLGVSPTRSPTTRTNNPYRFN